MKYLTDAASVLSYFLYEGKVRLIQKSSKIFFLDLFTYDDRARRAL